MTDTEAVLEVPVTVYRAVKALLERAGYDSVVHSPDGERISMRGIAIQAIATVPRECEIGIMSLVSSRTGEGKVEFSIGAEVLQVDVKTASAIGTQLIEAASAATHDAAFVQWLQANGIERDGVAVALLELRKTRQGSDASVTLM